VSPFKRNLVPLLCIAFVAAAGSTGIFYWLLGSRLRDASTNAPRQPLVVATRNLDRGTIVRAEDLKVSTWGGAEPLKGGYTSPGQIVGKTVYEVVHENEPITQTRLASRDGSVGIGVAAGMRAVSVRASDSSGVLRLLRPGNRVDVQVVAPVPGAGLSLRTTLQNLEVLAIDAPESSGGRAVAPVVTLLATPAAADQLGLADSAAHIRLLLRNPLDSGIGARPLLSMSGVFAARGGRAAHDRPAHTSAIAIARRDGIGKRAGVFAERVQLLVQVAGARPEVLDELAAKWHWPQPSAVLQAVAVPPGREAEQVFHDLEASHQIDVLWSAQLRTANHRSASMHAGASWRNSPADKDGTCGLRLRFLPRLDERGTMRIRVQPEITASGSTGIATRKMDTEVELVNGQSFLMSGLSAASDWPVLADRLFAGRPRDSSNRELVVLVTLKMIEPVSTAVVASRQ
jgi:Flp pilus assembly protein CpaB